MLPPHVAKPKHAAKWAFEELTVGLEAEFSVVITAQMIAQFSDMTGDYHPLHTDPDYAKSAGFDDIIAHGLLISSLSSRLIGMELPGKAAIVGSQTFDYLVPIPAGTQATFAGKILSKDERFYKIDVGIGVRDGQAKRLAKGKYTVFFRQNDHPTHQI